MAVPQLPVEEASTIAELGVVIPKLDAVIPQRQERNPAFKASEGLLQIGIRHLLGIHPQLMHHNVVPEAQLCEGKLCCLHHIPIRRTQGFNRNLEWQSQ